MIFKTNNTNQNEIQWQHIKLNWEESCAIFFQFKISFFEMFIANLFIFGIGVGLFHYREFNDYNFYKVAAFVAVFVCCYFYIKRVKVLLWVKKMLEQTCLVTGEMKSYSLKVERNTDDRSEIHKFTYYFYHQNILYKAKVSSDGTKKYKERETILLNVLTPSQSLVLRELPTFVMNRLKHKVEGNTCVSSLK